MARTHYLRLGDRTLVDAESLEDDLHVQIDIFTYSRFLLNAPEGDRIAIILDFDKVQEYRGEYHEYVGGNLDPYRFLMHKLKTVAKRYDLNYVED